MLNNHTRRLFIFDLLDALHGHLNSLHYAYYLVNAILS